MNTFCGLFIVSTILYGVASIGENERCYQNGGEVMRINLCETRPKDLRDLRNLHIYGYEGSLPMICCFGVENFTTSAPFATTTPRISSSTTEQIDVYDYDPSLNTLTAGPAVDSCAPLTSIKGVMTRGRTGQKAWDKCLEYQERLVYPCEESVAVLGGLTRYNHCRHSAYTDVIGYARREEYPHMALLGYKDSRGIMIMRCSGALISDRFILTAARCNFGRKRRATPFVIVGSLNGPQNLDQPQIHSVRRVIRHPKYRAPSLYHDIALVETETTITLDRWTVPACLDVFSGEDSKVVATKWTSYDVVHTETLKKLNRNECRQHLCLARRNKRLQRGYNDTIQVCYGSNVVARTKDKNKGGPITIQNSRVTCMYDVIGVTSIVKNRRSLTTGIFTRVSNYVPWIESIVWP